MIDSRRCLLAAGFHHYWDHSLHLSPVNLLLLNLCSFAEKVLKSCAVLLFSQNDCFLYFVSEQNKLKKKYLFKKKCRKSDGDWHTAMDGLDMDLCWTWNLCDHTLFEWLEKMGWFVIVGQHVSSQKVKADMVGLIFRCFLPSLTVVFNKLKLAIDRT